MSTIYDYLGGETDLGSDRVSKVLQPLGLRITSDKRKTGQRPRGEKNGLDTGAKK